MANRTHIKLLPIALILLTAASLMVAGCLGKYGQSGNSDGSGPVFVVGTDAPLASVVSFQVQVESLTVTDTNNNVVSLINGTPTVDFARYNGLQTLVDVNDLPPATYNQVSVTLGAATIGYLNVPGGAAPTIETEAATYPGNASTYTYAVTLANPVTVAASAEPAGVRVDLDLRQSIAVDGNGNITGAVTPTFHIDGVARTDAGGYIDEFIAAVVAPPSGTSEPNSFTVQGPHGGNFTVNTTSETEWDGSSSLSGLNAGTIIMVSGTLDRVDKTFDADEVAIISQNGFYSSGLMTYVNWVAAATQPGSRDTTYFDFYVRKVTPSTTGVQVGTIAQVDLSGNEMYSVYRMHNSFTQFTQTFFNNSGLVAGQDVIVGGTAANAANESEVTVNQVTLRHWGYNGTIVAGSEDAGAGTFQLQVNGFAGVVIPNPITVYLGSNTDYRYGLAAFGDLLDNASIRVVGLLIVNPSNGNTVLLARHIDGLDLADF